jgi:hypothetical protein
MLDRMNGSDLPDTRIATSPPVLEYSPPAERPEPVASMPASAVVLTAAIPFAGIFIVRGRKRLWIVTLQLLVIPAAFGFFGPVWDKVLFRNTPYGQDGLYPFIATVAGSMIASIFIAVAARRRYL